jgi:hypothetical protein
MWEPNNAKRVITRHAAAYNREIAQTLVLRCFQILGASYHRVAQDKGTPDYLSSGCSKKYGLVARSTMGISEAGTAQHLN